MNDFHDPVLIRESVEGLNLKSNGVYVDVTFGGGGHSKEIIKQLDNGKLIALDQDLAAINNAIVDSKFIMIQDNFRNIKQVLELNNIFSVDGIIADLGVSSYQFSDNGRGFSIKYDSVIDMRMNPSSSIDGVFILNNYSQLDLNRIFREYSDFNKPNLISLPIIQARSRGLIKTVKDLIGIFHGISSKNSNRFFARIFQAIRIEVNDELNSLKELLNQSISILKPHARLVVISYHSVEDRIVKQFMKFGNTLGSPKKDFYGNISSPFKIITKRPITPSDLELRINNKSRSAKLRICERK